MCGIVGYIGCRNIQETLLDGLQRLEYRGYDSAGIAIMENESINTVRASGKVSALRKKVQAAKLAESRQCISCGIAHTRWATHGPPTVENAHPHLDDSAKFAIVHNGIIENFSQTQA